MGRHVQHKLHVSIELLQLGAARMAGPELIQDLPEHTGTIEGELLEKGRPRFGQCQRWRRHLCKVQDL